MAAADPKVASRWPAGDPAGHRVAMLFSCRPERISVRVRAREVGTGHLRWSVDLRVARVGHLPTVGLVPREPVHLLRVGVVGDGAVARRVLAGEPGLPGSGGGLLVRGYRGLRRLRLVQCRRRGAGAAQGVQAAGRRGGDGLGERNLVRHRVEGLVVGLAGEGVVHRRGRGDLLVQRLGAEDLLDRPDDRQLRVVGVYDLAVLGPGADDLDRRAVAVDVVGAVLTVVLGDEDGGVLPVLAVRDRVDDVTGGEVVVGHPGLRVGRPAGVVAGEPDHVEAGRTVLLEVLLPDFVAVDVRDREVERR